MMKVFSKSFFLLTVNIRPAVPQSMAERTKEEIKKCKNFLETLIRLSSQQPQQTLENVKKLIKGLLVSVVCVCVP